MKNLINKIESKIRDTERLSAGIKALDTFNGKNQKPVNEKDLLEFPLLEWVQLNDKVWIRRRKSRFENYLNFDCKMFKGGIFAEHFHDDLIESTEVIEGQVIDLNNMNLLKQHDTVYYNKSKRHTLLGIDNINMLNVLFKK